MHDPDAVTWRFHDLGDTAMLVTSESVDLLVNQLVLALADTLAALALPGVQVVVPAINSALIRYDPAMLTAADLRAHVQRVLVRLKPVPATPARVVAVPVRYGGADGPDLADVAATLGISPAEVIRLHCGQVYRVMMIGFAPGYPYAGPLPPALHVPRRSTPRTQVPRGSVAIAAGLTGIYPAPLPGGWHVIGRTTLELFDPYADQPCLLQAGDGVQFVVLDEQPQR